MANEAALTYLWQSANVHVHEAPELSRLFAQRLLQGAACKKLVLPGRVLHRICQECFSLLVPGLDCTVRQTSHSNRPAARKRSLRVSCSHCGHASVFAAPARVSSRRDPSTNKTCDSKRSPAPAKSSAKHREEQGTKRTRQVHQTLGNPASGKKRPTQPSPRQQEVKPNQNGDFFGFDFVPL